jgi:uncharacterized protein (DUF2062 family)
VDLAPAPDTSPTQPPVLPPARTLWQRRVRDPITAQLKQGITPEKIALTLAIGGTLAMFPIFGTTSLLCFLAALALRLNQAIIQLLNQALVFPHVAAFYGCVRLGEWMFDVPPEDHFAFQPHEMLHDLFTSPRHFFRNSGETLFYACVAWAVLAPLCAGVVFWVSLPLVRSLARLKTKVIPRKSPSRPVP